MHSSPLFDPAGDGQEPDSALPPADPDDGPEQQGLYLCLPAGSLDTDQFTQSGPAADMRPDPLLATIIDTVTGEDGMGLAGLSDDQLIGVIAAVRRLESRVAWYSMATVREFAARNAGEGCVAEFAADQLAAELHLTHQSAAGQMDYASTVADRLPATFAALHAGTIHPVHVRIIEDETSILSPQDAARADAVLAEIAGSLTFGKLRTAAHRLVLELDPESAQRRKEAARRDAHVRRFREDSGNAGLIARELPPDEVLASWQHVDQRALDLRAAGVPGTLQELRVRAYLDLLQERDSRSALDGVGSTAAAGPEGTSEPSPQDDGGSSSSSSSSSSGPGGPGCSPANSPNGSGRARQPGQDTGPRLAALVNITIPWSAWTGPAETPAEVAGLGLVHAADARDLAAAAARDPRTRWCLTVLHPDGTAAAHGCATGQASLARHRPGSALRRRRAGLDRPAAHPDDPDRPRRLRPRPGRTRLPAQPRPPTPDPHPQRPVHRARLRPARHPMRLGPHSALAPGRADLRVRPGAAVPTPSSLQAGPGVAAGTARTGRPDLAHPSRPHLRHQTHSLPRVTPAQAYPRHQRLAHPAAPNEATGTKPLVCSEQCGEVDRDGDRFGDGHCPGMDSG